MIESKKLAVLILAAGTSSRLGEPKQLVRYKDKTLIYHTCKKALSLNDEVFVVLGANAKQCQDELSSLSVNIIENKDYKEGLASSLKQGVSKLSSYDKILVLLCDQPFIPRYHLQKLIEKSKDDDTIYCSFYKDDVAVPALFPKTTYSKILELNGDKGAKKLIKQSLYEAVLLEDKYAIDIDKKEDLIYLK